MNPTRHFGGMPGPAAGGGAAPAPGRVPVDHTWLIVFGEVVHFVVILAILVTLFLVVRAWLRSHVSHPGVPPALAELDLLYARGEVSRDDYLARRADLAHTATG